MIGDSVSIGTVCVAVRCRTIGHDGKMMLLMSCVWLHGGTEGECL